MIVPLGITGVVLYFVFKKLRANTQLVAQGEPAQAQILSASETGTRLNDQPEVAFALQVQRQGQPPYQANAQCFVSMMSLARLQPGAVVPVKVDPGNPLQVAIDTTALQAMPVSAPGMMPGMQPGMQPCMQPGMQPQAAYGSQPQAAYGSQPGVAACPMCQQQVPLDSPSCPHCGSQLQR